MQQLPDIQMKTFIHSVNGLRYDSVFDVVLFTLPIRLITIQSKETRKVKWAVTTQ
jgi:hypothetical protein